MVGLVFEAEYGTIVSGLAKGCQEGDSLWGVVGGGCDREPEACGAAHNLNALCMAIV